MTKLNDKIENSLNESRMLLLGLQVLIGFQFQSVFMPGFDKLSLSEQSLMLGGLGLLALALGWTMAPAPFHRIAEHGQAAPALDRFTTWALGIALLPFSLALAIDFYIAGVRLNSRPLALALGAAALGLALFFWYGWELIDRRRRPAERKDETNMPQADSAAPTPLSEEIKQVLTEARLVLPGSQALLGFQLAIMFTDSFERLSIALQYVHLGALAWVGVSMVLLMTPAAYHRIVEQGEDSQRFLRLASRSLLAAMGFLALGIACDFLVVVYKVVRSTPWALASAAIVLLFFYGLWFGYTLYRRQANSAP